MSGAVNIMDLAEDLDGSPQDLELLIKQLRALLKDSEMPGNLTPRTDSKFLSKFIRTKDYNLKKAFNAVKKYYKCIHDNLDFIDGIKPSDFESAFTSDCFSILKHRFDGVGVAYGRIKNWKPKKITLRDFQLSFIMLAEQYINQVGLQENGITAIVDFEGLRFEHLWQASVKEIKRTAQAALQGLPVRVREVHVLNTPSIFWPVYKIGKVFVKDKIHQRIHFHSDLASLHKFLDRNYLPESLGGALSEAEAAETNVMEDILKENIPYEEYWNGEIQAKKMAKRRLSLSRKRSSRDA